MKITDFSQAVFESLGRVDVKGIVEPGENRVHVILDDGKTFTITHDWLRLASQPRNIDVLVTYKARELGAPVGKPRE